MRYVVHVKIVADGPAGPRIVADWERRSGCVATVVGQGVVSLRGGLPDWLELEASVRQTARVQRVRLEVEYSARDIDRFSAFLVRPGRVFVTQNGGFGILDGSGRCGVCRGGDVQRNALDLALTTAERRRLTLRFTVPLDFIVVSAEVRSRLQHLRLRGVRFRPVSVNGRAADDVSQMIIKSQSPPLLPIQRGAEVSCCAACGRPKFSWVEGIDPVLSAPLSSDRDMFQLNGLEFMHVVSARGRAILESAAPKAVRFEPIYVHPERPPAWQHAFDVARTEGRITDVPPLPM